MSESTVETSSIDNTIKQVVEQVENVLSNQSNGTEGEKFKATPEGLFLAYFSLVIMALLPIIIGSFKSVKHQKKQQVLYISIINFIIKIIFYLFLGIWGRN